MFKSKNRIYISDICKKMFLSAFLTATFTEFIQIIALTIDSVIVCSFLSDDEVASVGIASPFFFLSGVPATCLAAGLQILCSREMGRGEMNNVKKYFSETLVFTIYLMSLFTFVLFFGTHQLAYIFGARGNVAELSPLTEAYLLGLAFDAAPFVILSVITPVVVLNNGNSTVMASSVAGAVTNIVFDIISVINGWGLFGIGLSSALSAIVSLCITASFLFRKDNIIKFRFVTPHFETISKVIKTGFPNAIHSTAGMIRGILLNTLVAAVGDNIGMSILSIHGSITDTVDIIAVGISGAVSVLSSLAYGERNGEEIESINALAHKYIYVTSGIEFLLLILFNEQIALSLLDSSSDGHYILMTVIGFIAIGIPFSSLVYSKISYYQALEKGNYARHLERLANLIAPLLFAFIFSVPFGIYGIFAAFPFSKMLSLFIVYIFNARKKKKIFLTSRDRLDLDDTFFPAVKDMISYPLRTLDDCVLASEQIYLFANGHKFDKRKAYLSSLAVEEVTTNIILHGKDPKKLKNLSEIKVTVAEDKLILHFRDSGAAFDLAALAKSITEYKDPYSNIGLRLIAASADDIKYYRIYKMNTVIIKI